MQTLGVSGTPVQSENRLKSLFWPTIQNAADVDYLGTQGYWVCAVVAAFTLVVSLISGTPIGGVLAMLFFYFGGVGVREHSRWAASFVFALYLLDTLLAPGILKIFLAALLLANVRGTWMASSWAPASSEADLLVRFSETWGDKFADQLPKWLWPKIRVVYYVYSVVFFLFSAAGYAALALHRAGLLHASIHQ